MFDKKVKLTTEEFKTVLKDIENEVRKDQQQQIQEFKVTYFTLKEKYDELGKNYIKVIQENDILKAKLQELSAKQDEETLNTLGKYSNLEKLLGDA